MVFLLGEEKRKNASSAFHHERHRTQPALLHRQRRNLYRPVCRGDAASGRAFLPTTGVTGVERCCNVLDLSALYVFGVADQHRLSCCAVILSSIPFHGLASFLRAASKAKLTVCLLAYTQIVDADGKPTDRRQASLESTLAVGRA